MIFGKHSWNNAWHGVILFAFALLCGCAAPLYAIEETISAAADNTLVIVVMDPLAMPLSCPCVRGYAQRDYQKLADKLSAALDRPTKVIFNESLAAAVAQNPALVPQIVIGKHSVVLADAATTKLTLTAFAALTNKEGGTTQKGLIVVAKDDPAKDVTDLVGYRFFFGPLECAEKHAAAQELLTRNHVPLPDTIETAAACDEGARQMLELGSEVRSCAVISSYARPLLEGCGKIEKGALRIVAETEPVPFVEAFVNGNLTDAQQRVIQAAIIKSTEDLVLRMALETKQGFVALDAAAKKK